MTLTPGLTLVGLLLVLLAIPLAFSFAPFVIGAIVLAYAGRRAHVGLSADETTFAAV
jgi:membrane protein implicated in regulation of membrane protease activity